MLKNIVSFVVIRVAIIECTVKLSSLINTVHSDPGPDRKLCSQQPTVRRHTSSTPYPTQNRKNIRKGAFESANTVV